MTSRIRNVARHTRFLSVIARSACDVAIQGRTHKAYPTWPWIATPKPARNDDSFSLLPRGGWSEVRAVGAEPFRTVLLGASLLALGAAGPPPDPDWPCVQRLVPTLTASTLWGGHDAAGDWRADPQVAKIIAAVAPRGVSAQDGAARLEQFMATVPTSDRPAISAQVFAGLVDQTNLERAEVIDRLRGIAQRQRTLTVLTSRITAELRALPSDAPAAQREEIVSRRGFLIREYEQIERTIRYACEAPVQMESKLGALAQALQRGLED